MPSTLYCIGSDSLGVDETIGSRLMQAFWNSLPLEVAGSRLLRA